jgi:hypothetical protein
MLITVVVPIDNNPESSSPSTGDSILNNGVPLDLDSQIIFPAQTFMQGTTFHGLLNGKQAGAYLPLGWDDLSPFSDRNLKVGSVFGRPVNRVGRFPKFD